jgi:hypothetical protein
MLDDRSRCGNVSEELLGRSSAALLLLEHRRTKFDALATDVNLSGPFD